MKKLSLAVLATAAAAILAPATASADVSFNAGVVTDYRYRGISQSRLKPALQGGVDFSDGGLYLGTWASTIKWIKDGGGDGNLEWDIYGGYKGEIAKDLSYDVGLLAYVYPSNKLSPSANTTEVYGALTYGPATLKYSHSATNLFGFANSKNSGYVDLSATFEVEGISITPHIGRQIVRHNGAASYTDLSLSISKEVAKGIALSATFVDTNTSAYVGAGAKDLGKTGLVLGVKATF
jgi:uncharacterized protein (TIGR02001 family)